MIQNLLFDGKFGCISHLTCDACTTRSMHYHKKDSHFLYVVSGHMYYYERAVGSKDWGEPQHVPVGAMIHTPPMREHKTYFPMDTELISISKLPRDHANHEQDVVRVA